jgi:hypothetical protein
MPPPEAAAGSHFPLVSVEYDRVSQSRLIADIAAVKRQFEIAIDVTSPLFLDLSPSSEVKLPSVASGSQSVS